MAQAIKFDVDTEWPEDTLGRPEWRSFEAEGLAEATTTWMSEGPVLPIESGTIWGLVDRSLSAWKDEISITSDGLSIGAHTLRQAIDQFTWPRTSRTIGIVMSRSISAIAATLAIWKHGGCYVPIAIEYPHDQKQSIIDSCKPELIISDQPLDLQRYRKTGDFIGIDGVHVAFFERLDRADEQNSIWTDDLCYIAHTSGSSGRPKSIAISHAGLINRLSAMQGLLSVKKSDRLLYKTPALFDVHIWEFLLPLVAGCHLHVYRENTHFSLFDISTIIIDEKITLIGVAPIILGLLLKMPGFVALNRLRTVICGGEAWDSQLAREFYAKLPDCALLNSYGPAETTMVVMNWPVPNALDLTEIALGSIQQNTVALVEERSRSVEADGLQVYGKLLIGGLQVGLGYVGGDPNRSFCERTVAGVKRRYYATGDLVRLDCTTGLLYFRGREDNEVKVNGVRIRLEEIESVVRGVGSIEACVAFVTHVENRPQLRVAFKTYENDPVSAETIRAACSLKLSPFSMPSFFRQVENLPLKHSGKLDRKRLAQLDVYEGAPPCPAAYMADPIRMASD